MGSTPEGAKVVIVVAGGEPLGQRALVDLPVGATVIAADSGLDVAEDAGLAAHVVVGDLDSVDPDALGRARSSGARVEAHPADKDATDLELALDAAIALGATDVVVLGGHGGRLDHHLANVALLAAPAYAAVRVSARMGDATVHVVRTALELAGEPGELVSLLAVGGPVPGVRTTGLRWALHDEVLLPTSTRGVSNELADPVATISVGPPGALRRPTPGAPGRGAPAAPSGPEIPATSDLPDPVGALLVVRPHPSTVP